MVIHPGLTYELFHYTMVHFDHILSGVQIEILVLCTVVTFVHYYKFQVLHDFFHVIMVQFEIFLGVGKNCNYCCILQDNL